MMSLFTKGNLSDRSQLPGFELDLMRGDDLLEFIDRAEADARDNLAAWYRNAVLNMAWASGNQHLSIVDGVIKRDPRFEFHDAVPQTWTNLLKRYLQGFMSRIQDAPRTFRADPVTGDEADIASARALDVILPYWWKTLGMDDPDAFPWLLWTVACTGVGYVLTTWNDEEGADEIIKAAEVKRRVDGFVKSSPETVREIGDDDDRMFDAMIQAEFGGDADSLRRNDVGDLIIRRGRMDVGFLDGFQVIEDPTADRWKDVQWVIVRKRVSVARVRDIYGKDVEVSGESDRDLLSVAGTLRDQRRRDASGGRGASEMTTVRTLYHRRTDRYPDGILAETAETTVLKSGVNPYEFVDMPVIRIAENPDRYDMRPSPTFDDLQLIQKEMNDIGQMVSSHIRITIDPDLWAENGSVHQDEMDKPSPALRFHQVGANPPQPQQVEQIGSHVLPYLQSLVDAFKDLANLTNPAIGAPDSQVRSGRAIGLLNERSDRLMSPVLRAIEFGMGRVAENLIGLWAQFEPEDRDIRIVGEGRKSDVHTLRGESLVAQRQNEGRFAVSKFDVKVSIGEIRSKASTLDSVDLLASLGLIDPADDRSKVIKAINDGILPELDKFAIHRTNASEENEILKAVSEALGSGKADAQTVQQAFSGRVDPMVRNQLPFPVFDLRGRPGDDPQSHLDAHDKLIQSDEWPDLHPLVQFLMVAHYEQHFKRKLGLAAAGGQVQSGGKRAGSNGSSAGSSGAQKNSRVSG